MQINSGFLMFPGREKQSRYSQTGDNHIGSAHIGIEYGYAVKFYFIWQGVNG